MLDELVRQCKEKDISEIVGYFYKTAKNNIVSDLYDKFGFKLRSKDNEDTIWNLNISHYTNENKFIRVQND